MAKKKKPPKKNAAAQAMVAIRNKNLSPAERKAIAVKAAAARWGKKKAAEQPA